MGRIAATNRESICEFDDTMGAFHKGKSRGVSFFSPYMSRTISLFYNNWHGMILLIYLLQKRRKKKL